jgi:hypothetical protein
MAGKTDPRITKRRVTMTTYMVRVDDKGTPFMETHQAIDYVRPDFLEAYVQDAQTRWQHVEVSDEPDAGPGGYDGETVVPEHLLTGKYLQQHLADLGIKPLDDPTNGPDFAGGRL